MNHWPLTDPIKNTWRASETEFQVFLEGGGLDVNLVTGEVVRHGFAKRPLLFDLNFMHLNSGKAPWTGIADVYGGMLIVMALTGIFLVRGRKGLSGRGGVMMALGFLLPIVYAIVPGVAVEPRAGLDSPARARLALADRIPDVARGVTA